MVRKLTDPDESGWETATLARKILETWDNLELVYKIPKRTKSDMEGEAFLNSLDIKRFKGDEGQGNSPVSQTPDRFQSWTPASTGKDSPSQSVRSNYGSVSEQSGVIREIEIERPELSWNQFVPRESTPKHRPSISESVASSNSKQEVSTPTFLEGMAENSIEQMVEAAQRASQKSQEEAKKKQLAELEKQKKVLAMKKKKMKEHKKEQRALSQALAGKLLEKAIEAAPKPDEKVKSSKSKHEKERSEKKEKSESKPSVDQFSEESKKMLKNNVSLSYFLPLDFKCCNQSNVSLQGSNDFGSVQGTCQNGTIKNN